MVYSSLPSSPHPQQSTAACFQSLKTVKLSHGQKTGVNVVLGGQPVTHLELPSLTDSSFFENKEEDSDLFAVKLPGKLETGSV